MQIETPMMMPGQPGMPAQPVDPSGAPVAHSLDEQIFDQLVTHQIGEMQKRQGEIKETLSKINEED